MIVYVLSMPVYVRMCVCRSEGADVLVNKRMSVYVRMCVCRSEGTDVHVNKLTLPSRRRAGTEHRQVLQDQWQRIRCYCICIYSIIRAAIGLAQHFESVRDDHRRSKLTKRLLPRRQRGCWRQKKPVHLTVLDTADRGLAHMTYGKGRGAPPSAKYVCKTPSFNG